MGRNTELKLRKVYGTERFFKLKEKLQKPAEPPKKELKLKAATIVTKETESRKNTICLLLAFMVFGGLGVYFKFLSDSKKDKVDQRNVMELFGENPNIQDDMIKPHNITPEEIKDYHWTDNPIAMAKLFTIIAIIRENSMKARIKINLPEFETKRIPLRSPGDMLTEDFRIISINEPVVFLSDKKGKIHRLVDPKNWNSAASLYNWNKNVFKLENTVENKEPEGMTPEEEAITFGDYELVNATEEQISALRTWSNANPDYRFEDFSSKCTELGIVYKMKLKTTMGGMMKPNSPDEK